MPHHQPNLKVNIVSKNHLNQSPSLLDKLASSGQLVKWINPMCSYRQGWAETVMASTGEVDIKEEVIGSEQVQTQNHLCWLNSPMCQLTRAEALPSSWVTLPKCHWAALFQDWRRVQEKITWPNQSQSPMYPVVDRDDIPGTSWGYAQVWYTSGRDFRGGASMATKNAELGFRWLLFFGVSPEHRVWRGKNEAFTGVSRRFQPNIFMQVS